MPESTAPAVNGAATLKQPDLGVIIVTYNSERHIGACIDSLQAASTAEVLVVDNHSSDNTLAELQRRPNVRVITNESNRGYSVAANQGAQALQREFLCFLNPDCEPEEALLSLGYAALAAQPGSCFVPKTLIGPGHPIAARRPAYTRRRLLGDIIESNLGIPCTAPAVKDGEGTADWHWPHGACIFVTRAQFRSIGGFNECYPMYMVDVDFGRRLHEAGGDVQTIDTSLIHHEGSGSAISSLQRLRLLNAGRIRYARANYGTAFATLLYALAWPAFQLRSLRQGLR